MEPPPHPDLAIPDPSREIVLDSRSLRGLAHPLRVRLLGLLRSEGPSTASRLAQRVSESSGATSYHLRQLAAYGFVREVADHGQPRERWWAAVHRSTYLTPSAVIGDDEAQADAQTYLRAIGRSYADQVEAHVEGLPALDQDWQDASTLSDFALRLTAEQTAALRDELVAVISRYPSHDVDGASIGAREVVVQVQVFRRPGQP